MRLYVAVDPATLRELEREQPTKGRYLNDAAADDERQRVATA